MKQEIKDIRTGRSPCGERGLKSFVCGLDGIAALSLPVRGAWVEIGAGVPKESPCIPSLPVRGAWVEIFPGS